MKRLLAPVLFLVWLAPISAASPPVSDAFAGRVRPLLRAYCVGCHNPDDLQGGVNLAAFADDAAALAKPRLWKRARNRVAAGEMPPDDAAKQPTAEERTRLIEWMTFAADYVDCDPSRRDPGPATLRRLTRAEYIHTVRDLLGVHLNYNDVGLPEEQPSEHHFSNFAADLALSPALMEKYFGAADVVIGKMYGGDWYADGARRRFAFVRPGSELSEREAARQVLSRLLRRAYRRPADLADVDRLLGFFERAKVSGADYDDALRACLKPVLVSPQFLLRIEDDRPAIGNERGAPIDAHELATRLSYFLWASMPDDQLFAKADDGTLPEPEVFDAQVRRMVSDVKARALTDTFAVEWVQLKKLNTARPTTEFFPAFNGELRNAMQSEVLEFFEHLRISDGPITDLLDADYTFANEALARHYGIPGVSGNKMRKVALQPENRRGGLLGMGAVLAMTSHTFRTSPTQRGKYVLEVIFGTPPPPPPANVGELKDDSPQGQKQPLTFKEQLARHATQASCAGCHKKIDPLGFALDNYDAIGAWRESTADRPLDVAGVLPTGERVDGAADLKRVILARKDEFARNFAARMLEYALGRELEPADECAVREILEGMTKDGYRLSAAVLGVSRSVPFRHRRADGQ